MQTRLRPFEADRLRAKLLTYAEAGATAGELPAGYHHVSEDFVIGQGRDTFEEASRSVLRWDVQRRAGIRVIASSDTVELDAVAVLLIGVGPVSLKAPVRVVSIIDEPARQGFAYGTLPGHPESGEESFVVSLTQAGGVVLTITAFSRPATALAKAGGPISRSVQRRFTRRYGRALA